MFGVWHESKQCLHVNVCMASALVHFIVLVLIPSCGVHRSRMFHKSQARKKIENESHKEREKKGWNLTQRNIGSKNWASTTQNPTELIKRNILFTESYNKSEISPQNTLKENIQRNKTQKVTFLTWTTKDSCSSKWQWTKITLKIT